MVVMTKFPVLSLIPPHVTVVGPDHMLIEFPVPHIELRRELMLLRFIEHPMHENVMRIRFRENLDELASLMARMRDLDVPFYYTYKIACPSDIFVKLRNEGRISGAYNKMIIDNHDKHFIEES